MKIIAPSYLYPQANLFGVHENRKDKPAALEVDVSTSKSISNRLLIIQALSGSGNIIGLSEAEDTQILHNLLTEMPAVMDVGHGGTTFRFLTAYLAIQKGTFILTGSERMKQRPIGILVDVLNILGADITYMEEQGYPPLQITGKKLTGRRVEVNAGRSSQFISALMLIAPYIENGVEIVMKGNRVSTPYLEMTAELMSECGVEVKGVEDRICVSQGRYLFEYKEVEKDWSAISFWYELVGIGKIKSLLIRDVKKETIQGDQAVIGLFQVLGIDSVFDEKGLHLSYKEYATKNLDFENEPIDMTHSPDLIQPYVVTLAAMGISKRIIGTVTLKIKETDRAQALKMELQEFGCQILVFDDALIVKSSSKQSPITRPVKTYKDHRMAMAFAPLALKLGEIDILDPDVVQKSYPHYWDELKKLGFRLVN